MWQGAICLARMRFRRSCRSAILRRGVLSFIPSCDLRGDKAAEKLRSSLTNLDGNIFNVANEIVDRQAKLPKVSWLPMDLFWTQPKRQIIATTAGYLTRLSANGYLGNSGGASRLLYGEKGIGKSSSLKLACVASYMCHPTILPIYVEYSGSSSANEYGDPSYFISRALNGPDCATLSIPQCLKLLESRGQYVFFIADEVDQVYSSREDESKRLNILGDLSELASQPSGRVFTMLCGSASVTPQLISKNGVHYPDILNEYPLLANCPNLNGSKFSSLRLSSGIPVEEDLIAAAKSFGLKTGHDAIHLLYFLAGNNLRVMDKIVYDIIAAATNVDDAAVSDALSTVCFTDSFFPPDMWDQRASKTSTLHKHIIHGLNMELCKKNRALISGAARNLSTIGTIPWVSALKPLTYEEVVAVLRRTSPAGSTADALNAVNQLVDKGFFSAPPSIEILLPSKPLNLLHYYPVFQRERETWWRSWFLVDGSKKEATMAVRKELFEQAARISVTELLKFCF